MSPSQGLILRELRSTLRGPFSIEFEAGCCSVVTGPSGSGKSLLLRMIADLDPNDGTVSLSLADRSKMSAPDWRKLVTYVAAESGWWGDTAAEHMIDLVAARRLMSEVGLDAKLLDAPVAQLSTGERQRAALVRAIVRWPRFLLLDEPTSALDLETKFRVEAVLGRLKEDGIGLVIVSHDAEQVARIADRRFVMSTTGLTEDPR